MNYNIDLRYHVPVPIKALRLLLARFTSGNSVPLEKAVVPEACQEIQDIKAALTKHDFFSQETQSNTVQPIAWFPCMPMSSAPKDGTVILVFLDGSDIPYPVRWKVRSSYPVGSRNFVTNRWCMTWDGYPLSEHDGPIGWIPLPRPFSSRIPIPVVPPASSPGDGETAMSPQPERSALFRYLDNEVAKDMAGFYQAFGRKPPAQR